MKRVYFIALILLMGVNLLSQEYEITGKVNSQENETELAGVLITVEGTAISASTNERGEYKIMLPEGEHTILFSSEGRVSMQIKVASTISLNVSMELLEKEPEHMVLAAQNILREEKTLSYSFQELSDNDLSFSSETNILPALSGMVAGLQIYGQAGSKLGQNSSLLFRGPSSIGSFGGPSYIVDGIPVQNPNNIDVESIENITFLKGINAAVLYGNIGADGVVLITTKSAGALDDFSVEFNSNTSFDKVANLPKYQNEYGGGYYGDSEWSILDYEAGNPVTGEAWPGEWEPLDGQRYIENGYADESWGPKFDGLPYIAWYNLWPDSPYYGQTAKWQAQPNNVRDFYATGVTLKNTLTVSRSTSKFNARISYTNSNQNGIIPYSGLKKNMISGRVKYNISDRLSITGIVHFSKSVVDGYFDDSSGNHITGIFNSNFNRNIEMNKMKELVDLQTTHGYHASWNYWNPSFGQRFNTENAAYWFNPYFLLKHYVDTDITKQLLSKLDIHYSLNEAFSFNTNITADIDNFSNHYELPSIISNSADPDLYNVWNNGFGNSGKTQREYYINAYAKYRNTFGKFGIVSYIGANTKSYTYDSFSQEMSIHSKTQVLLIPDLYEYTNILPPIEKSTYSYSTKSQRVFANAAADYNNMVYWDMSVSKDWSLDLSESYNRSSYFSLSSAFVFSELIDNNVLTLGKIRAGWVSYGMGVKSLDYVASQSDKEYIPNSSIELGVDVSFIRDRIGMSFTYFNESRSEMIIMNSGSTAELYQLGSLNSRGIDFTLNTIAIKSNFVTCALSLNLGKVITKTYDFPDNLEWLDVHGNSDAWGNISMGHHTGDSWGQLRGRAIGVESISGLPLVNSFTGTYSVETKNFGSILPDYNGGVISRITLGNLITISTAIDFQKGGKFFSLSEMWGTYSGLLEETAGLNDKGILKRDDPGDGGGVHVTGIDDVNGQTYDSYVDAEDYFRQFQANHIAEPYIHDASYLKLREIGLYVTLPENLIGDSFIRYARVGIFGRNLLLLTSSDNVHGWDPSELSSLWGENAQYPGIKSYGFNVKIAF